MFDISYLGIGIGFEQKMNFIENKTYNLVFITITNKNAFRCMKIEFMFNVLTQMCKIGATKSFMKSKSSLTFKSLFQGCIVIENGCKKSVNVVGCFVESFMPNL